MGPFTKLSDNSKLNHPRHKTLGTKNVAIISTDRSVESYAELLALGWAFSPTSFFLIDTRRNILLDVNPAAEKLTGYARQELLGMSIYALHPEAEYYRLHKLFRDPESQPLQDYESLYVLRKDGSYVQVAMLSTPLIHWNGIPVIFTMARDLTEQERARRSLETETWALSAYSSAALALRDATSKDDLLHAICEAITKEPAYVLAWVAIGEEGPGKPLKVVEATGSARGYLDGLTGSWSADEDSGLGAVGTCIRCSEIQIIDDTETSPFVDPWRERLRRFGVRSIVAIPFSGGGSWRGALVVFAAKPNAFEARAIQVFQRLVAQINHGFHALDLLRQLDAERFRLQDAQAQLSRALAATVIAMATTLESRDPYTAGHANRAADLACAIGKELGWPEDKLQGLRIASVLHDIGKIAIPAEILTKPSRLSKAEYLLMCDHAEIGYNILKGIPFPWPVAQIVYQHHERIDGSGYPQGLKADAILPESKVLAVADVLEAMVSHRPYRPALNIETIFGELEKLSGGKLDAEAVRICLDLFRKKDYALPVQI